MRPLVVLALAAPLLAGCTPYLPMRSDFGTSALAPTGTPTGTPTGDVPPEFTAFNAYDPGLNPVLAAQICATPFEPRQTATVDARPGQLISTRGTCATHVPLIGN